MQESHRSSTFLLPSLVAALLASLLYIGGLGGSFVFDDGPNIVFNDAVQMTTLDAESLQRAAYSFRPGGGTRALSMLSLGLDHWRAGLDPRAFKTTNLVIHALTTLALAWLFRQLLSAADWPYRRASVVAIGLALAWSVHPLQVSSVLYAVQRMQTLATLFSVLALWAYLHARLAQIAGQRSRNGWILTVLFACLAFASKEDAIVLPAYLLALELTVLGFRAADPGLAARLRLGWTVVAAVATLAYACIALPHFWSWEPYPGRDYSTLERLLTQPRMLMMYLGQILFPLPSRLPFYYDWIEPSRSLLVPWTTLPALLAVLGLIVAAWLCRVRRPLFSLGVFLFFAGHFVSSNVIGLELAFEHRNHFPLIGAVLAIADLLALALGRLRHQRAISATAAVLILSFLAAACHMRATIWGDTETLAVRSTEFAPRSSRAWNSLCLFYHGMSGGTPGPLLDKSIAACEAGASRTSAVTPLTNLVVFKALRGDLGPADWERLHERLRTVPMSPENAGAIWVVLNQAREQAPLDEEGVLGVIRIVSERARLRPVEFAAIGYYILEHTSRQDEAYTYFAKAVEGASSHRSFVQELTTDLRAQGRDDWADRLDIVRTNSHGSEHR